MKREILVHIQSYYNLFSSMQDGSITSVNKISIENKFHAISSCTFDFYWVKCWGIFIIKVVYVDASSFQLWVVKGGDWVDFFLYEIEWVKFPFEVFILFIIFVDVFFSSFKFLELYFDSLVVLFITKFTIWCGMKVWWVVRSLLMYVRMYIPYC